MGRSPCCSKEGLNKGPWTAQEDKMLADHIKAHGEGKWNHIPKQAGLKRCGKSCRLRWLNYLRPNINRGNFTEEEQDLILRLHKLLGNRWSLIAGRIPGRTDSEIKNYLNSNLCKKLEPAAEATVDNNIIVNPENSNLSGTPSSSSSSYSEASGEEDSRADLKWMDLYMSSREISLSEFLDTDFTKFANLVSQHVMQYNLGEAHCAQKAYLEDSDFEPLPALIDFIPH